jgi:hypothetical protein
MRLSLTITAPTARRRQVVRLATSAVMSMKYVSQDGRGDMLIHSPKQSSAEIP